MKKSIKILNILLMTAAVLAAEDAVSENAVSRSAVFRGIPVASSAVLQNTDEKLPGEAPAHVDVEAVQPGVPLRIPASSARILSYLTGDIPEGITVDPGPETVLYVCPETFLPALQPLISWKERTGMHTEILSYSEYAADAETADAMIKAYCTEMNMLPSHLVLIGDVTVIPSFNGSAYPDPSVTYSTDHPYALFDGPGDAAADVILSRIPAGIPEELSAFVSKILAYESGRGPASMYSTLGFITTSDENFHDFVEARHREIASAPAIPGDFAVSYLDISAGDGNEEVIKQLESGLGLLCYSGHGSSYSWQDGSGLSFWNPGALDEMEVYPIILSLGCSAGDLKVSRVDDQVFRSLGQTFVMTPDRGASAFIGGSFLTRWYEDAEIEKNFYRYLFNVEGGSAGEALAAAKLAVLLAGDSYGYGDYYQELYHYFGDGSQIFHRKSIGVFSGAAVPASVPRGLEEMQIMTADSDAGGSILSVTDGISVTSRECVTGLNSLEISGMGEADTLEVMLFHPDRRSWQVSVPVTDTYTIVCSPDAMTVSTEAHIAFTVTGPAAKSGDPLTLALHSTDPQQDSVFTAYLNQEISADLRFAYSETLSVRASDAEGEILASGKLPVDGGEPFTSFSPAAYTVDLDLEKAVPGYSCRFSIHSEPAAEKIRITGLQLDTLISGSIFDFRGSEGEILTFRPLKPGYSVPALTAEYRAETSRIKGYMRDAVNGSATAAASFTAVGDEGRELNLTTDQQGFFESAFAVPLGLLRIRSEVSGYSRLDTVLAHNGSELSVYLSPRSTFTFSGTVFNGDEAVENAEIRVRGQGLTALSGGDGNFSIPGVYNDSIRVTVRRAGFTGIDSLLTQPADPAEFELSPGVCSYYFGFEDDDEGFSYSGDWDHGIPDTGMYYSAPGKAAEGQYCAGTRVTGFYSPYSDSRLISPEIHLQNYGHPTLAFLQYYVMDRVNTGYDGGNVLISSDNGANWRVIEPGGGYDVEAMSGSNAALSGEPGFSGDRSFWHERFFDLAEYAGQSVRFAFHFGSTSYAEESGWYIDALRVLDSTFHYNSIVGEGITETRISAYPNPFNSTVRIRFDIPGEEPGAITIHDISGRAVRHFQAVSPGSFEILWDGRDDLGRICASGVYLMRGISGKSVNHSKILLIK